MSRVYDDLNLAEYRSLIIQDLAAPHQRYSLMQYHVTPQRLSREKVVRLCYPPYYFSLISFS